METIERAALGRSASLGDLYDARSDQFCGVSLFKEPPLQQLFHSVCIPSNPDPVVTIRDNPSVKHEFILSDTMSEKLSKLGVENELKASVITNLVALAGHGLYLAEECATAVSCSLLCSLTTKVEQFNMPLEQLQDRISPDALRKNPRATHVVIEIRRGANVVFSLTDANDEDIERPAEEIQRSIKAELIKLIKLANEDQNVANEYVLQSRGPLYNWKMFSDILLTDQTIPKAFQHALAYIKHIPKVVQQTNDGNGIPVQFTLFPLSFLQTHFEFTFSVDRVVRNLEHRAIDSVVKWMDKLNIILKEFDNLYDSALERPSCIKEAKFNELLHLSSVVRDELNNLRKELGGTLIEVRAGREPAECLEILLDKFDASEYYPAKIKDFLSLNSKISDKIKYIEDLIAEKVVYIGHNGRIDTVRAGNILENWHILFLSDDSDENKIIKTKDFFYNMVKGSVQQCFMVVDLELRPDLRETERVPKGVRICLYNNGRYINYDVMKEMMPKTEAKTEKKTEAMRVCKARINPSSKKTIGLSSKVLPQPIITHRAVLSCPNCATGKCPTNKRQWHCESCDRVIEYGFDRMLYCDCYRAPIEAYEFKCDSDNHGESYVRIEKEAIDNFLSEQKPPTEYNILILGETGVGKSTFINGIVNYLRFDTLEKAVSEKPVYVIPASFTMPNDSYEMKEIAVGPNESQNERFSSDGHSCTQEPISHCFGYDDKIVRLIDTPGMADTTGVENDKKNFDKIIRYISDLEEINGICILLKPSESRINVLFRYCVTELLTHLHRSAADNIVFCFTHTRGTLYRPGDTYTPLKTLLNTFKEDRGIEIPLSRQTMYCFDNESFRFLCAVKNDIKFEQKETDSFSTSWERSAAETRRLFEHITSLRPHKIADTVSLNDARSTILCLTKPMADMSTNIDSNIASRNQQLERINSCEQEGENFKDKLYVENSQLIMKPLESQRTVCTSPSCTETKHDAKGSQTIYKKVCCDKCTVFQVGPDQYPSYKMLLCRAMTWGLKCRVCECSWRTHMHTMTEYEQQTTRDIDPTIQELIKLNLSEKDIIQQAITISEQTIQKLTKEQEDIAKTSAKFGSFLKNNSIVPYNDVFQEYVEFQIFTQRSSGSGGNQAVLNSLIKMKEIYLTQVKVLKDAMEKSASAITEEDVHRLIKELFSLPIKGAELKAILDVARTTQRMRLREAEKHNIVRTIEKNASWTWKAMKKSLLTAG